MIKRCDINEQITIPRTNFVIHERQFYTPERIRSIESNRPAVKKVIFSVKKQKTPTKIKCTFCIKGSSKSWVQFQPLDPSLQITEVKRKISSPSLTKPKKTKTNTKSKLQAISTLLTGLKLRYSESGKASGQNYHKSNLLDSQQEKVQNDTKDPWQYKHSKMNGIKQHKRYKLLHLEGYKYRMKTHRISYVSPLKILNLSSRLQNS